MLGIGIQYLNGWAMAAHPGDRRAAEWPPHPDRIFMAMAAAHFETDRDADERAVLEWLESLDPPDLLAAKEIQRREVLSCYVPPNDLSPPDPGSHANGKLVRSIREDGLTPAALKKWLKDIRKIKKASVVSRGFDFLELRDRVRAELQQDQSSELQTMLLETLLAVQEEVVAIDWKAYAQEGLGVLPQFRSLNLKERCFPVVVPKSAELFLIWDNTQADSSQKEILDRLCRKVIRIGHSASLVQMWVADEFPEATAGQLERLGPGAGGRHRLRITRKGRLANLERRYNEANVFEYARLKQQLDGESLKPAEKKALRQNIAKRFGDETPRSARPEAIAWSGYQEVKPLPSQSDAVASRFADMILLKQVDGRRFGLESTLQLTEHLRKLVMKFSGQQPVPNWLSGHQPDGKPAEREFGHTAFVPIPHVSWRHADGHLLGMAIVPPRDISPADIAQVFHPVLYGANGSSNRLTLKMGHGGTCSLEIVDGAEGQNGLRPEVWAASADRWATVTPVALDRHAKKKNPWDEIAEIVGKACVRIGLPAPVDVIPSPVSMFIGAPTGGEMPRIERKSGGRIRHTHAIIRFDQSVAGPVLLGAGRYRGYGLCRPLDGRS
ncbi:MAG: type I-U CRISPR-associated protein Csb2 [Fuerstiella sp.]